MAYWLMKLPINGTLEEHITHLKKRGEYGQTITDAKAGNPKNGDMVVIRTNHRDPPIRIIGRGIITDTRPEPPEGGGSEKETVYRFTITFKHEEGDLIRKGYVFPKGAFKGQPRLLEPISKDEFDHYIEA